MVTKEDVFNLNNLEVAFQRLKFGPRHIHKTFYWKALKDIEPFREDYFQLLIEKFSSTDRVENTGIVRTYLPKSGGFVRPITYVKFESLLVYQAIANKCAESFYPSLKRNYNIITFGNHFNADHLSKFSFLQWKKRWKRYQEVSKNLIDLRGFHYVVDFDIASFYDSIDHKLLTKCLRKNLSPNVVTILLSILQLSHSDFVHINPGRGSGIPQGPIGSIIISEIFLDFYIDQYFAKHTQRNEIAYIRYADDIRVFSQEKKISKRFITILDLLCRNSGLIPQSSKVIINFYENSRDIIDQDIRKFSQVQRHYQNTGQLKAKTLRKAHNSVKEMLETGKFDKTKFSFYIYKLNKDKELRDLLIASITEKYEYCDPILFYLRKHYSEDEDTIKKLVELFIIEDNFFLDYPIFSFLNKFLSIIPFSEDLFFKMYNRKEATTWLSKVPLIRWALHWEQKEIILSLNAGEIDNMILRRELLSSQHSIAESQSLRRKIEINMLNDEHVDLSFNGISLIYHRLMFNSDSDHTLLHNSGNIILDKILKGSKHNPVAESLRKFEEINHDPTTFFSANIFSDENEFDQLSVLCNFSVNYFSDNNYNRFIDSVDQFNHITIERLFYITRGERPKEDFGSLLKNESFLSKEMIGVRDTLLEIHRRRNGELHPKDIITGKFYSRRRAFTEMTEVLKRIFPEWLAAIEEILVWYELKIE
jgi:hypothetical protein